MAATTFESDTRLLNQILEHRLEQDDIRRLLGTLSSSDREEFLGKLADVLGKMNALLDVSNRLADSLSLDVLFRRLVEITSAAVNADRGTIFLNDAETNELFSRVAMGDTPQEIRFPNDKGIAGAVFTSAKAIIIPDAYADERFNPEVDKKTGYRTRNIITAPIRTKQSEVVGVLQLLNKKEGDFSESDLSLLEALASQASSALQNAQLFEQVERAREEETYLQELTQAISTELHLLPLLQKIMDTSTKILQADRSTLFLNDEKTHELWSQVAQGMDHLEIRFPNSMGIAGEVFTSKKTVNIPDAYADARFNQAVDKKTGYKTDTILCCPVLNKEAKVIGVTQVLNKEGGPFNRLDERRLKSFSAQAAIAIENAKLFEDVLNMKNYSESMLQSMSNGVLTLSATGRVEKCNRAAAKILCREMDEFIDRDVVDLFSGANQWVVEMVSKVAAKGEPDIAVDAELFVCDDKTLTVNFNAVPLKNSKLELLGTMLVFEDISGEKRLKGTLARYMTKEVADKLLEGGDDMLGGKSQEATVLFSDIRSFTTLSETLGAEETVSMLNEYFTIMVDILFEHQGILDKYIGDAIMAVFGTPFATGHDEDNAVSAAVDMMRALYAFNIDRASRGKQTVNIGIGVNTNPVVVGNIGSLRRMDYTAIGDGVNLAARLESACKTYRSNILVSEFTCAKLQDSYIMREADRMTVKGKTRPVAVYEVLDFHTSETFPHMEQALEFFAKGQQVCRGRDFEGALALFEQVLGLHPGDGLSSVWAERCRYYLENPPPEDWDGSWVMLTK
ncbi:GAF domain-containing protein [Desulfovibrio ferrophilus]|uniref:GAF and PAS/PAC sensor-containing adenylate/guanylate cyclase n=1 Tax=Desulfovibrio ferrophilus TaxID=241368 RepID=A0A2Z6AZR4_9BACT|nr:GAF domain-containing protein [Desulfovibrio ferrophilus]BBD08683.1 GAF and PAS/PAC sensor-containing adenylate/guanylate cyclase [Desulfovibrio ferrophilus]